MRAAHNPYQRLKQHDGGGLSLREWRVSFASLEETAARHRVPQASAIVCCCCSLHACVGLIILIATLLGGGTTAVAHGHGPVAAQQLVARLRNRTAMGAGAGGWSSARATGACRARRRAAAAGATNPPPPRPAAALGPRRRRRHRKTAAAAAAPPPPPPPSPKPPPPPPHHRHRLRPLRSRGAVRRGAGRVAVSVCMRVFKHVCYVNPKSAHVVLAGSNSRKSRSS